MKKLSTIALLLTLPCVAKRHSRELKIERYERRAREAAKANTPLAQALGKRTKVMSFNEAALALAYYREQKHDDMIVKCGERILAVGGDQEIMRQARLDLAQAFLSQGKYNDAQKHARDYLTYYPGAAESKRASYIAVTALYKAQSNSYRDQKKTQETIEQAEAYLEKYADDTQHKTEIQEILTKSYLKLIRSELNIIETHLNMYTFANRKGALTAAWKRAEYIRKHYLQHTPHAEHKLLEAEITIAQAEGNRQLLTQKQEALAKLDRPTIVLEKPLTYWERVKEHLIEDNDKYFA